MHSILNRFKKILDLYLHPFGDDFIKNREYYSQPAAHYRTRKELLDACGDPKLLEAVIDEFLKPHKKWSHHRNHPQVLFKPEITLYQELITDEAKIQSELEGALNCV